MAGNRGVPVPFNSNNFYYFLTTNPKVQIQTSPSRSVRGREQAKRRSQGMPGAGQGGGAQSLHPKNPHHPVTPEWLMIFTAIQLVFGASNGLDTIEFTDAEASTSIFAF